MAIQQPDPAANAAESTRQYLRDSAAGEQVKRSPEGKVLARRFEFSDHATTAATVYSLSDRRRIVEELRLVLAEYYVHLDRKRQQYGFDPVRALDLLTPLLETVTDVEFHQTVVQSIARIRDRHVTFYGRAPLGLSAVLPFLIERCWEGGAALHVATKVESGFEPKHLKPGAIVTHWNGVPIERFVRLNANVFDGGNEAASLARSLEFLTRRPLNRFATPLEEWVDLRFTLGGTAYEERFAWQGFATRLAPATPPVGRNITGFGGDLELLQLQNIKQIQFSPESFDAPPTVTPSSAEPGVPQVVGHAANFDYGSVMTEHGTFGYVRLWDFTADGPDDIAKAFVAALSVMPRSGLIIDMRGNSGGYIAAGERVLQLFTPRRIVPTRFQFRVTPGTRRMVAATDEFKAWKQSFEEAFATGEPFSQGYPIEGSDDDANRIGQKYYGPVVIITDALAFSTADIFAAGFIDHGVGRVVCIDKYMAAAGGNNWTFAAVRVYNPDFRLDGKLKAALDTGDLSREVIDAFNREGTSLSDRSTLSAAVPEFDGVAWRITDGRLVHVVRFLPWMNDGLNVYLDRSRDGLADLPSGVQLGLTMRRCFRVGKNEGRLLEDLGIQPDVLYQMTLRDVIDRNRDLVTRASLELSRMPAYDLDIEVVAGGGGHTLKCRTRNLTSLEAFADGRHLASAPASDTKPGQLEIPDGTATVEVKGFDGDSLVAKALTTLFS